MYRKLLTTIVSLVCIISPGYFVGDPNGGDNTEFIKGVCGYLIPAKARGCSKEGVGRSFGQDFCLLYPKGGRNLPAQKGQKHLGKQEGTITISIRQLHVLNKMKYLKYFSFHVL